MNIKGHIQLSARILNTWGGKIKKKIIDRMLIRVKGIFCFSLTRSETIKTYQLLINQDPFENFTKLVA